MDSSLFLRASLASVGALIVPWEVLVSALVVSAAAEVVLLLVAAAEVLAGAEAVAEAAAGCEAESCGEAQRQNNNRLLHCALFSVCAALRRRSA